MTKKDWLHLASVPDDIRRREARIARLERQQADGPICASDTVQSSTDAGDATIICHATVHGIDTAYDQRQQRLAGMRAALQRINDTYWQDYAEACESIEREPDPVMRCILHDVLLENKSYTDAYPQDNTADASKKRVYRWIEDRLKENK